MTQGYRATLAAYLLIGLISAAAALNEDVRVINGLSHLQLGACLAAGALAPVLFNHRGVFGTAPPTWVSLVLQAVFACLPVVVRGWGWLLMVYAMQGVFGRLAMAGLMRAINQTDTEAREAGRPGSALLSIEAACAASIGVCGAVAMLARARGAEAQEVALGVAVLGVATAFLIRNRLPDLPPFAPAAVLPVAGERAAHVAVFAAYGAEIVVTSQVLAWGAVFAGLAAETNPAARFFPMLFWLSVAATRWFVGQNRTVNVSWCALSGAMLCVGMSTALYLFPDSAWLGLAGNAALGLASATWVPWAVSYVRRTPVLASELALTGPVVGLANHLLLGQFPGGRYLVVIAVSAVLWRAMVTIRRRESRVLVGAGLGEEA